MHALQCTSVDSSHCWHTHIYLMLVSDGVVKEANDCPWSGWSRKPGICLVAGCSFIRKSGDYGLILSSSSSISSSSSSSTSSISSISSMYIVEVIVVVITPKLL